MAFNNIATLTTNCILYSSISLWHDDSRVSREVLGGMFPGVFLGEVKIKLADLDTGTVQNAWYVYS